MANINPVSFQSPGFDYSADISAIERKRRLAEALQSQAMEPMQSQTAGGWVIPTSPMQGISKLAQAWVAGKGQEKADLAQRELATKAQGDLSGVLSRASEAYSGRPAIPAPADNLGGGPGAPAEAPDALKAANLYMTHPMTAQLGTQLMGQELARQRLMAALQGTQGAPSGNPMAPGPGSSVMAGSGSSVPPAAPQQPGMGGPAGGQPMALWLATDPSGKSYAEQLAKDYAESQKPVVDRGFGIKRFNAATGKYDLASNPADITAVERAKQEATQPFQISNVTNAAGAQVPTFHYQLPGYPGATPQGAPQPAPAAVPKPAAAAPQPATPNGDPWATVPKRPIPQGTGQTTYDKTLSEHQATSANELSKKYGELADHANQRKVLNDQALSLVDKADTGPAAAGIADVKNWLTSRFGISEDKFQNTPSATIALQKDLLNAATQKAKAQFGARMTQSEVLLMLSKGAPNVDMTKAAIKYLIASDNASADYQIKQANDLGTYLQKGGDPLRFDAWYGKTFPMTKAVGQVHLQTNGVKDILDSGGDNQSGSKVVNWSDLGRKTP